MPTSARTSLGFFGQLADVGIRAPAQNGLLQQALTNPSQEGNRDGWTNARFPSWEAQGGSVHGKRPFAFAHALGP